VIGLAAEPASSGSSTARRTTASRFTWAGRAATCTPAPPGSRSLAEIRTENPPNSVYFDELNLTSNMMPNGFFPLSLKNYRR